MGGELADDVMKMLNPITAHLVRHPLLDVVNIPAELILRLMPRTHRLADFADDLHDTLVVAIR